jgi:hypothetical protein
MPALASLQCLVFLPRRIGEVGGQWGREREKIPNQRAMEGEKNLRIPEPVVRGR